MDDGRSSRLRAAIVGSGYIGAVHAESLRRVGGDVSWIVGRSGSDLAARAAALGAPRFTSRLDDALEDAAVDVVHVCTPNALHYPIARAALVHGKHLVCEKPLTTSAADAADLVRRAQETGVVAGVAWNQEQPNTLTIRRRSPAWEVLLKDPTLMASEAAALAHAPGGHPEGYLDAFRNLIAAIYDAIQHARRGETPGAGYPTLEDGYRGVLFVEAALQSARERRWVAVGSA